MFVFSLKLKCWYLCNELYLNYSVEYNATHIESNLKMLQLANFVKLWCNFSEKHDKIFNRCYFLYTCDLKYDKQLISQPNNLSFRKLLITFVRSFKKLIYVFVTEKKSRHHVSIKDLFWTIKNIRLQRVFKLIWSGLSLKCVASSVNFRI